MQQAVAVDYGVGFSLSLDYGTSVVYTENGTSIGVAKIEGSPAYKALMHAQTWLTPKTSQDDFRSRVPLQQMPLVSQLANVDSWCDRLPDWICTGSEEQSVITMSQMLQGLKAATESYLTTELSYVNIATPNKATENFTHVLASAATRASLQQDDVGILRANIWAANINTIEDYFCEESVRVVLALDYSRAGLTATLIEDDCGMPYDLVTIHDRSVGTRQWSDDSWSKLVREFREFIAQGRREFGGNDAISKIVLLGESANDERLKDILREVLLDKDVLHPIMHWNLHANSIDVLEPIDPLYAAAAGVASRAWTHLFDEERGGLCQVPIDLRKQIGYQNRLASAQKAMQTVHADSEVARVWE